MSLQIFKLYGEVKINTGGGEKDLLRVDAASKETKKGLDAAGDAAEKTGAKFDKASGRMRDASGKFVASGEQAAASAKRQQTAVSALSASLDGLFNKITRIGVGLTASVTAPLAGAAAAIIYSGSQTETALNRLQGTSNATAAQMDKVRATARDLGKDLTLPNTSAKDAALAMLELNKGGLSVEQSMEAARGTIQLAKAALIGEAQAATITADALNTFNLEGSQATRVADLLAGASSASSGEVTDMASALAQAGAVAKASNASIEDTVTLISLLAKNGIKGESAGTAIKTFLTALQTPVSQDAAKYTKALIGSAYEGGKLKPVTQIIKEFQASLSGLTEQSRNKALKEIFGQDAMRAALIVFGEGTEGFKRMSEAVTRSGQAAEQAEAATKGLAGAWGGLVSVAETIGNDIYDDFKEPLTNLVLFVTGVVSYLGDAWNSLSPVTKTVVAGLLAIAAAAGPVLVAVGGIGAALAGLGTAGAIAIGAVVAWGAPLIAVFAAAGVAVYAFYQAFERNIGGIRDLSLRVWSAVSEHTLGVISLLSAAWARFYPTLSSLAQKALALVVAVWESTGKRIVDIALVVFSAVAPVMRRILAQVLDVVDLVLKVIDGDWQGAWKAFVRFVVAAVQNFIDTLGRLPEAAARIIGLTVKALLNAAVKFHDAGMALGRALIAGLLMAVQEAPGAIAEAIASALYMAASGVGAENIGASLAARFMGGLRGGMASATIDGRAWKPRASAWGEAPDWWGEKESSGGTRDLPLGNKGGGGGGKKANDLTSLIEQLRDAEGARALAGAAFDVTQFKAGLDAEESLLEASLRAQTVSVADYWKARERITLHGLDVEINLLRTQQKIADETYKAKFDALGKGEKNPAERALKQQQLSAQWAERNYQIEGQLAEATTKRAAAMKTIPLEAAAAARELEKTMTALRADALEAGGDSVGAAYERIADKFREMHEQARANSALFPDADKWVSALERAEKLSANLTRLGERFDLGKGYLSLETARIQDKVTDGVLSEREGRRQVYDLEVRYRDVLRGILGESLAIAKARGDEKAVLQIKEQIRETERLGHVIDTTREKARGIFEGAFSHGLAELNKGLGHAAATFAIDLIDGIKREADARLTKVLSEALFGKTDEFGSDSGLFGKVLERIGLGGLFGGKGQGGDPASTVTATIEKTAQATQARLDTTEQDNTVNRDYNTDRIIAALHELDQTMESMRPAGPPGFFKGLLGAAVGGFVSGLTGGLTGKLFGGGGADESGGRVPGSNRNADGSPILQNRNGSQASPHIRPRTVGHALGGLISGPGGPTDDKISAFLSNGEFVMSAAAVRRIGVSALQYMNTVGRMPQRFAAGGYAGSMPTVAPARVEARDSGRPGSNERGAPVYVSVSVRPDAQGRVRSRSQIEVEVYQSSTDSARRNS